MLHLEQLQSRLCFHQIQMSECGWVFAVHVKKVESTSHCHLMTHTHLGSSRIRQRVFSCPTFNNCSRTPRNLPCHSLSPGLPEASIAHRWCTRAMVQTLRRPQASTIRRTGRKFSSIASCPRSSRKELQTSKPARTTGCLGPGR
jgi:hypothetical protein